MTEIRDNPFANSWLKVDRAGKHILELHKELTAFQRSHPYEITVEHDADTGYDCLHIIPFERVPESIMCIVGDALHNLRTALDYAASDIEFATTRERTKFTKFPVDDTRDKVKNAINGGFKHKAPERVRDFILDVIQPYKGGNGESIWALHALDILDKHILLIAQIHLQYIRNVRYKDETGKSYRFLELATTMNSLDLVRVPTTRRNIQITDKGKAAVGVFFGDGIPFERHSILKTLRHLFIVVSGTLVDLGSKLQTPQAS
ncbi:MAG TPA: hypothetical protein VHX37_00640 [Acidobacteriaceae bacterium]|jgi:hypothetical protein|nr:hypothetical protein [Acidobacteriaceae bacterium]